MAYRRKSVTCRYACGSGKAGWPTVLPVCSELVLSGAGTSEHRTRIVCRVYETRKEGKRGRAGCESGQEISGKQQEWQPRIRSESGRCVGTVESGRGGRQKETSDDGGFVALMRPALTESGHPASLTCSN